MLIVASTRGVATDVTVYALNTVPDRGVARSCDPLKKFGGYWFFNHITGMAEPKFVTFCNATNASALNAVVLCLSVRMSQASTVPKGPNVG